MVYTVIQSQQQQTQQFVYGSATLMIYFCAQKNRRELVLQPPGLNGIDYLEVLGSPGCGTQLAVTFLKRRHVAAASARTNISITGGDTGTGGMSGHPGHGTGPDRRHRQPRPDRRLLPLHASRWSPAPAPPIRRTASTRSCPASTFSFKAGCPSPADCLPVTCCPPALASRARHQLPGQGLRRLPAGDARPAGGAHAGLDRDARRRPRHRAGRGARLRRRSPQLPAGRGQHRGLPRHRAQPHLAAPARPPGRLPDRRGLQRPAPGQRHLDSGTPDSVPLPRARCSSAAWPGLPRARSAAQIDPLARSWRPGARQPGGVLRRWRAATCVPEQNVMPFYTWGDEDCCLPAGATGATLAGTLREPRPRTAC